MKIGLDIDNTMYHLNVIEKVSNLLGLNYKSTDVKHWVYDKKEINGFSKYFTDLVFAYFDKPDYMCNLKLYDGVYDKVLKWKIEKHELYVISARKPNVQIETVEMLKKDFHDNIIPPQESYYPYIIDYTYNNIFKSIHFVEHKTNAKVKLFKDLNLDIWIDDNPKDLRNACELGIKVFAIKNKYTKYNHNEVEECINIFDNCKAVEGIKDIEL